jgi:GDP-L-fucose synthase
VGFEGDVTFDASMPDGSPKKLLVVSKLYGTGRKPQVSFGDGIENVYNMLVK